MARAKTEEIDEKLLDEVASLLKQEKPITKKLACEKLGIKYNTKRLDKLIQDREDYLSTVKRMRKKLRGKPADFEEKKNIIGSYLEGQSLSEISKQTFRSLDFVKRILQENNVPLRSNKTDYFHPEVLPEESLKEEYTPGDIVFSARYNQVAKIVKLFQEHNTHGKVYSIVLQKNNERAYQPWYELGDLTELFKTYNLNYLIL